MIYIDLEKIRDNPYQPRQVYNDMPALIANIKNNRDSLPDTLGLIHIPTARLIELDGLNNRVGVLKPDQFPPAVPWAVELAEGHRRLRAFTHMAAEDPAYLQMPVNLVKLDDVGMDNIAWDENAQRLAINPVEEARALARTMEDFGLTQEQIAQRRGLGRSTVANKVRLLKLPDDMLAAIGLGRLSEKVGIAYLPALDIKPHQMEKAHPPLTKDPGDIYNTPTPNALKRRLLSEDDNTTAADVRRIVAKIKDACTIWPCEKCGANCKAVRFMKDGEAMYCYSCWESMTAEMFCPGENCGKANTVKIEGETHTCWYCRQTLPVGDYRDARPKFEPEYRPMNLAAPEPPPGITPAMVESCKTCGKTAWFPPGGWTCSQCERPCSKLEAQYPGDICKSCHITNHDSAPAQTDDQPRRLDALLGEYAVFPCHNCNEKTIAINPEADAVKCEACASQWDSIDAYHTERRQAEQQANPPTAEPPAPTNDLPYKLTARQLARIVMDNDGWQLVTTAHAFTCPGCEQTFEQPDGKRAWRAGDLYLCAACFSFAGLPGRCPQCGITDNDLDVASSTLSIHPHNMGPSYGARCPGCGHMDKAANFLDTDRANIPDPARADAPANGHHSPDLARQTAQIDVFNRFLALTRRANPDQLAELDAWLDDVESQMFAANITTEIEAA